MLERKHELRDVNETTKAAKADLHSWLRLSALWFTQPTAHCHLLSNKQEELAMDVLGNDTGHLLCEECFGFLPWWGPAHKFLGPRRHPQKTLSFPRIKPKLYPFIQAQPRMPSKHLPVFYMAPPASVPPCISSTPLLQCPPCHTPHHLLAPTSPPVCLPWSSHK